MQSKFHQNPIQQVKPENECQKAKTILEKPTVKQT